MSLPVYPGDDLDRPEVLRFLLGSFWSQLWPEQGALEALLQARGLLATQSRQDRTELLATLSRQNIPVGHLELFSLLSLDASQAQAAAPTFGSGILFGASELHYGPGTGPVRYPVREDLLDSLMLLQEPFQSAEALFVGLDYVQSQATLTFLDEPPAALWALPAWLDRQYLSQHAGLLLNLSQPDSPNWRRLLNAVLDAVYNGPSYSLLTQAVSALFDIPCTQEEGEVVQLLRAGDTPQVITDRAVYTLGPGATFTVVEGDILTTGQPLGDGLQVLQAGRQPLPSTLAELTIPARFLDPSLSGTLTFANSAQSLTVTVDVSGFTKLSWAMTSSPGGLAAQFFTLLHARGVAAGMTLANYLDRRPQPQSTQPDAASLPSTINPLELLWNELWRAGNVAVVLVKTARQGPGALTGVLDPETVLRWCVPPHAGVLVIEPVLAPEPEPEPELITTLDFSNDSNSQYLYLLLEEWVM